MISSCDLLHTACYIHLVCFFPCVMEALIRFAIRKLSDFNPFGSRFKLNCSQQMLVPQKCLVQNSLHHWDEGPESEKLWTSYLKRRWKGAEFLRKYDTNTRWTMWFLPFNGRLQQQMVGSHLFPHDRPNKHRWIGVEALLGRQLPDISGCCGVRELWPCWSTSNLWNDAKAEGEKWDGGWMVVITEMLGCSLSTILLTADATIYF